MNTDEYKTHYGYKYKLDRGVVAKAAKINNSKNTTTVSNINSVSDSDNNSIESIGSGHVNSHV
ncbi:hypothetical protein PIROE2DRAFT_17655 [Piromyces sp. E2]|nr:hypothetical protein PIROE2DRAFT_17655 [Piromyces sp. E2]|eukprot:OUM57386.1 hypothetical protein PIROE2DRAFT_17655 [Piromyces sp. E2]